jgi:phosphoribosylglycinamide formyltransferase-1
MGSVRGRGPDTVCRPEPDRTGARALDEDPTTVVADVPTVPPPGMTGPARARIVVLISGTGSNLQALIDAAGRGQDLHGDVVLVASDRPGAAGLDRAAAAGLPTAVVDPAAHADRAAWEAALVDVVAAADPDLVVLAGFMKILSGAFVGRFRTVNVHPSLLPAFAGAHAPADALRWGVKVSGVTVHLVDEQVDHGPIIAQEAVPVEPGDTAATLHARIQAVEHRLLPQAVAALCAGRVRVDGRVVTILDEPSPTATAPTPPPPTPPPTP